MSSIEASIEATGHFIDAGKLAVIGGTAVAGLAAIDLVGAKLRWSNTEHRVDFCGERPANGAEHVWRFYPAHDHGSSEDADKVMGPELLDAPPTYVAFPDRKPNLHKLGHVSAANLVQNNTYEVSSLGVSLGGVMALYDSLHWPEDVTFKRFICIDTPFNFDHLIPKQRRFVPNMNVEKQLAKALKFSGYRGGAIVSGIMAAALAEGSPTLLERAREGWNRVFGPESKSPEPWAQGLVWMLEAEEDQPILQRGFRNRITDDTFIAYVISGKDNRVNGEQGANALQKLAGRPITRLYVPDAEHADVLRHPEKYRAPLRQGLQQHRRTLQLAA